MDFNTLYIFMVPCGDLEEWLAQISGSLLSAFYPFGFTQ